MCGFYHTSLYPYYYKYYFYNSIILFAPCQVSLAKYFQTSGFGRAFNTANFHRWRNHLSQVPNRLPKCIARRAFGKPKSRLIAYIARPLKIRLSIAKTNLMVAFCKQQFYRNSFTFPGEYAILYEWNIRLRLFRLS